MERKCCVDLIYKSVSNDVNFCKKKMCGLLSYSDGWLHLLEFTLFLDGELNSNPHFIEVIEYFVSFF